MQGNDFYHIRKMIFHKKIIVIESSIKICPLLINYTALLTASFHSFFFDLFICEAEIFSLNNN